jgi:hypothetical protein
VLRPNPSGAPPDATWQLGELQFGSPAEVLRHGSGAKAPASTVHGAAAGSSQPASTAGGLSEAARGDVSHSSLNTSLSQAVLSASQNGDGSIGELSVSLEPLNSDSGSSRRLRWKWHSAEAIGAVVLTHV